MQFAHKGLTQNEAKERLSKFGPNTLPEKPLPSKLLVFISQVKNPLVYLLLISASLTFWIGHYSDSLIILFAVLINTILGYLQENKANRALAALKLMIKPTANVVRNSELVRVDAQSIVVGDIVYVTQGDKVPADGKLIDANKLFIEEAILTGESKALGKSEGKNVFMGTLVVAGNGLFEVTHTAASTEMGKIAQSIQDFDQQTPLKRQLSLFSIQLVYVVLGLTSMTFVIGLLTNLNFIEMLSTSIALIVAAIPEGLLVGLTVVLAIGMQRILKRNGLVRNLASAETLGGVTTICVDKTGTLTQGNLQVVGVSGKEGEIARQFIYANDLDDPIVISARVWAIAKLNISSSAIDNIFLKNPVIDRVPFSSKDRYFASLNQISGRRMLFVNGAPERVLDWCKLRKSDKLKIIATIEQQTAAGNRVIGLAKKIVSGTKDTIEKSDIKNGFRWVGLIYFSDPVRSGVKDSLAKAKRAGVRIIVITGDFANTAIAVMSKVGLEVGTQEVITGDVWEQLTENEKASRLSTLKLFARTSPQQKLSVVSLLKERGEVVAMMGDGVNDAPALNKADIGIVVGEASDVSKETADLILLDSEFETIVAAIEEGRGIFENIRKVILYLMSTAFNEIITVVGALILGLPIPVTAAQILWINIVTDGFPDLALTVDPKRRGLMSEKPRLPNEHLVSGWMRVLILIVSVVSGIMAITLFAYAYGQTRDVQIARSVGFLSLGLNSLFYVYSVRTLNRPIWEQGITSNWWLVAALVVGLFLQFLPFLAPFTRDFFEVQLIPGQYMLLIFFGGMFTVLLVEIVKYVLRGGFYQKRAVTEVL